MTGSLVWSVTPFNLVIKKSLYHSAIVRRHMQLRETFRARSLSGGRRSRSPKRRGSPPRRGYSHSPRRGGGGGGYRSPPRGGRDDRKREADRARFLAVSLCHSLLIIYLSRSLSLSLSLGQLANQPGMLTKSPPLSPDFDQGCYLAPTTAHVLLIVAHFLPRRQG